MKVTFSQSGGFAPRFLGCELDASTMPPADAARLRQLVAASGIESLKSRRLPYARDLPAVSVTVEAEGQRHSVTYDLTVIPETLAPLVAFLLERAENQIPGAS